MYQILSLYADQCQYLRNVIFRTNTADGKFVVEKPFYVKSTGHINAIDINICHNQLGYCLINYMIGNKKLDWSLDDFATHQLSNIYILNISMIFHKKIVSQTFMGKMNVIMVEKKSYGTILNLTFAFDDNNVIGNSKILLRNIRPKL